MRGPGAEGRGSDKTYSQKLQLDDFSSPIIGWAKYFETLSHFSKVLTHAKKISLTE